MNRRLRLTIALAATFALSACASPRAPLVLDSTLQPDEVDEVMVLPVIDARPTPYELPQVARNVGDAMVRFLRERGYFTIAAEGYATRPHDPIDLHVATAEQLVPLSPEDAKYFVLVQVEKIEPGVDATEQVYDARLSAVMVDRPHSRVVWRDVATGSSTLGGVLTVFAKGSRQYEAAVNASKLLVETLPDKRPKK